MTRETKIGLLVGLAFIIVIGILLSDHFTSSMAPPVNPKNDPARSVMEGLGGTRSYYGQRSVEVPRGTPSGELQIGQGPGRIRVEGPMPPQGGDSPRIIPPGPGSEGGNTGGRTGENAGGPGTGGNDRSGGDGSRPPVEPPHGPTQPPVARANLEHKAAEGDTVWKLARQYYHRDGSRVTAADVARIVNANESLRANKNKIVVGETYVIPPLEADVGADATDGNTGAGTADRTGRMTPFVPPATGNEDHTDPVPAQASQTVYTTKPGDSLWKIAYEQCGSGSRAVLDQIRAMNKDVLKNGDNIQPQMKLKLPPKTVASAN